MSTRSNIIRENTDGSYDSIYCHWDGYPSHNGRILLEHYTDPAKVDALIALGDLSVLAPELGEKHDFDDITHDDWCMAFGRDRGEQNVSSSHFDNADQLAAMLKESWTEWVYVFKVADGQWYYTNNPSPTWFKCCGTQQRETELLTLAACEG